MNTRQGTHVRRAFSTTPCLRLWHEQLNQPPPPPFSNPKPKPAQNLSTPQEEDPAWDVFIQEKRQWQKGLTEADFKIAQNATRKRKEKIDRPVTMVADDGKLFKVKRVLANDQIGTRPARYKLKQSKEEEEQKPSKKKLEKAEALKAGKAAFKKLPEYLKALHYAQLRLESLSKQIFHHVDSRLKQRMYIRDPDKRCEIKLAREMLRITAHQTHLASHGVKTPKELAEEQAKRTRQAQSLSWVKMRNMAQKKRNAENNRSAMLLFNKTKIDLAGIQLVDHVVEMMAKEAETNRTSDDDSRTQRQQHQTDTSKEETQDERMVRATAALYEARVMVIPHVDESDLEKAIRFLLDRKGNPWRPEWVRNWNDDRVPHLKTWSRTLKNMRDIMLQAEKEMGPGVGYMPNDESGEEP